MAKSYEELEFTDNFMFVKIMISRPDLKQSYVIFICKNGVPGNVNRPVSTYKNICIENPEEYLDDGTCTVLVNADCADGEISSEMWEFLEFIRTGKSCGSANSLTGRLHSAVTEAIRTGEWSVEYMWAELEMNKRYLKGKEEGRQEGLEAGRQEERKNTEAERKRAEEEQKRAEELSAEVARLKAELEALKEKLTP